MKNKLYILMAVIFFSSTAHAQITMEYLDINHVKAGVLTHGDMFWNPTTGTASYQFPQGSNLNSNFASSIWIAGYDTSGNLHVSAQTYRQDGNDYWPGPLDNTGTLNSSLSNDWDKIWKVNKTTIDSFLASPTHTLANTPPVILEWPAKGNINAKGKAGASLTITKDMAPFFDVNTDGIYNALDGDYPKIKGEQALWWVFSDNGPTHNASTGGIPFKLEVQAMAFACNSIPAIQNTTYYSFAIKNYGAQNYSNVRIGIWDDIDLGYGFDDYVGVDTSRRLAISYNGDANDDGKYGTQLTQTGCLILRSPLDSLSFQQPLGSYMFYKNEQNSPVGNPVAAADYAKYLNATWKDGLPLTNACNGRDAGTNVTFIYPSDPSDLSGWSEKNCSNIPNDQRFVLSTSSFSFNDGDTRNFDFAIINTPSGSNNNTFAALQALADSAKVYANGCGQPSIPSAVQQVISEKEVSIYPNPANDKITVKWSNELIGKIHSISIINPVGAILLEAAANADNHLDFPINTLANGIYFIQIHTDSETVTKRFVKK